MNSIFISLADIDVLKSFLNLVYNLKHYYMYISSAVYKIKVSVVLH